MLSFHPAISHTARETEMYCALWQNSDHHKLINSNTHNEGHCKDWYRYSCSELQTFFERAKFNMIYVKNSSICLREQQEKFPHSFLWDLTSAYRWFHQLLRQRLRKEKGMIWGFRFWSLNVKCADWIRTSMSDSLELAVSFLYLLFFVTLESLKRLVFKVF